MRSSFFCFFRLPIGSRPAFKMMLMSFLALAALIMSFPLPGLANPSTAGFVLIPAGTFLMGTQGQVEGENAFLDETPQHTVTITKAFYMKATEVTRGEWFAVMGTRPWLENGNPKNNVHGVGTADDDDYPATYISYNQAVAYCTTLNNRSGGPWFRLPTEAEWEYACRQGQLGNDLYYAPGVLKENLGDFAWYRDNSEHPDTPGESSPHIVATKQPASFGAGLFDMHGNVAEWVSDWYSDTYYAASPQNDPTGPAKFIIEVRVVRGGDYNSPDALPFGADDCRCANRDFMAPATDTSSTTGFRVVMAVSVPGSGGSFVPAGGGSGSGGGCYIQELVGR